MSSAFGRRLLRINLTTRSVQSELLPEADVVKFIGGRSLGAKLLYDEVPAGADPLGPENKLILTTGPLTGTTAQGSSRYCVNAKSPLTGLYLMSLSGGYFGPELKRTGNDVLVIEGESSDPVYLFIKPDGVDFRDARLLRGMNTGNTQEFIKEELGDERVRTACIGPAGENLVPFACLVNERRVAGRGGAGAVMGSKKLKAIAVRGNKPVGVADPEAFRKAARQAVAGIAQNPMTREALPNLGTNSTIGLFNEMGIMPFRNWQQAASPRVNGILAENMREHFVIKSTHCAPPCSVRTSKITLVRTGPCAGSCLTDRSMTARTLSGSQGDGPDFRLRPEGRMPPRGWLYPFHRDGHERRPFLERREGRPGKEDQGPPSRLRFCDNVHVCEPGCQRTDMYEVWGWDVETGIPTPEKLADLGLHGIASDMRAIRV